LIEEFRAARNTYAQSVKYARTQHWEEWIENTDKFSMWIVNKFVTAAPSDGGSARIPTLKVKDQNGTVREVADNAGKSKALYDSFFYPPPEDPGIDEDYAYPRPKFDFIPITDAQVKRAIRKLKCIRPPGRMVFPTQYLHTALTY